MISANSLLKAALRLTGGLLVATVALAPAMSEAAVGQPRDCDNNAMMFCGAFSKAEFDHKLQNGDGRNSAANLQQIYLHEGLAFNKSDFDSNSTVDGTVFKDGRVVINQNFGSFKSGDVVATNTVSDGRMQMQGSVKRGSLWETSEQTAFVANSIPAFVSMKGGTMQWFVIKSCGNFGHGKPVVPKKPAPKPTPTPTRTTVPSAKPQKVIIQQQQQQQQQQKVVVPAPTTVVVQQQPQVLSQTTVAPAPQTLVQTGPAAALGGTAGLAAIGYAGRAYLRSKKSLLGALRKKNHD